MTCFILTALIQKSYARYKLGFNSPNCSVTKIIRAGKAINLAFKVSCRQGTISNLTLASSPITAEGQNRQGTDSFT